MGRKHETHRYAFVSRAAALMNAAAAVPFASTTTSLPTLNMRTLSYLRKVLIVSMYESSRLVVHAGESRSIEPLTGRVRSMLYASKQVYTQYVTEGMKGAHGINPRSA